MTKQASKPIIYVLMRGVYLFVSIILNHHESSFTHHSHYSKEYLSEPWWPAIIIKSSSILRYLPSKSTIEEKVVLPTTKRIAFFLSDNKHQIVDQGWTEEGFHQRSPRKDMMEKKEYKAAVELANKVEKHFTGLDPLEMEKIGKAIAKGKH